MHWEKNKLDLLAFFLLLQVYFQVVFLLWLSTEKYSLINTLALSIGLPLIALMLTKLFRKFHSSHPYFLLWMCVTGLSGMIIGSIIDFGLPGMLMLSSWCTTYSELNLNVIWAKLKIAPWTYCCMIVASLGGMFLAELTQKKADVYLIVNKLRQYLICGIGMLAGMLIIEAVISSMLLTESVNMFMMIILMQLGMIISMFFMWMSLRVMNSFYIKECP